MIRWLLATVHLLALGVGFGAIWGRARAFRAVPARETVDRDALRRVFRADNLWGVAAILWLVTGLLRAFAGYERTTGYYLRNGFFLGKMAGFLLILALEIWPMLTLIRWRARLRRGLWVDTAAAPAFARISAIQTAILVAMTFFATALARGYGALR